MTFIKYNDFFTYMIYSCFQKGAVRLLNSLSSEDFTMDEADKMLNQFELGRISNKRSVAIKYMVTACRDWGGMSPMTLAMRSNSREILTHELCCEVTRIIWKRGGTFIEV
jgi:hypothetical protein